MPVLIGYGDEKINLSYYNENINLHAIMIFLKF